MAKEDSRVRSMTFSSEQPVDRWFGNEILDHNSKSVRMGFINSGNAPFLLNHDRSLMPIGVIEKGSVKIGRDKRGYADTRFGKSAMADEALTNVDDEIMRNTSVGYRVYEMRFESEKDGDETYRVIDWEPHEVSLVGIPADVTVGMGRGEEFSNATQSQRSRKVAEETSGAAGNAAAGNGSGGSAAAAGGASGTDQNRNAGSGTGAGGASGADPRIEVIRSEEQFQNVRQMEEARIRTIRTLCKANNIEERMERIWISGGTNVEQVAEDILRIVKQRGDTYPQSAAALGLSANETKRFSLLRAVQAVADQNWSKAAFELECSREIAKKLNKLPEERKFFVPFEVQQRQFVNQHMLQMEQQARQMGLLRSNINSHLTRADTVGTSANGGYLVETINLSFIELLRNRTVAFRLGATNLSGLVGNVSIPKQTGAATAMWLSTETTQITEVEQTFGQLSFTPHTVGGYTEISRLLLLQSSPDIEGIVNADLAAIVGIALDAAVINGPGTGGAPHGIVGLTGVGTGTGTTLGLAGLLTAQGAVGTANVVPVRGGWAGAFNVSQLLRARNEFANTYSPLWYGSIWDGQMVGYPALASNQIPSGDLVFGDWAQVVVAEWGVLEVEVNPYANFQAGIIGIRAIMTVDVGIRYPAAFYVTTAIT